MVWLTDKRRLVLFPGGTIVRDPHHHKSPTRREQVNKNTLSLNYGKRMQSIYSKETYAYGTSKDLVRRKKRLNVII